MGKYQKLRRPKRSHAASHEKAELLDSIDVMIARLKERQAAAEMKADYAISGIRAARDRVARK